MKGVMVMAAAGWAVAAPLDALAAADARLVKELAPLIARSCIATGNGLGVIEAGPLLDALLSKKITSFDTMAPLVGRSGATLAPIFLKAAKGDNQSAYLLVGGTVRAWTAPGAEGAGLQLPLADGGVEVQALDGRSLSEADTEAVLANLLDRSDLHYRFVCKPGVTSTVPTPENGGGATLLVAKEPTDLTVPKLKDRPFAEFAYLRDEDAGRDTYSFYGTLGIGFGDRALGEKAYSAGRSKMMLRLRPLAFAQLEYEKASNAANAKVDNLNVGVELGGTLQSRGATTDLHFWALSLRYLSDTRLASSGWSGTAKWTPYLSVPGNIVPYALGRGVAFQWRVTGVADHAGFSDIGRKTELATSPHYTRLGVDGAAELRVKISEASLATLGGTYGWRENLERGGGSAERLGLRLTIAPSDNFSIGLGYDHGRNLDTLEHARTIKLTIGIRK